MTASIVFQAWQWFNTLCDHKVDGENPTRWMSLFSLSTFSALCPWICIILGRCNITDLPLKWVSSCSYWDESALIWAVEHQNETNNPCRFTLWTGLESVIFVFSWGLAYQGGRYNCSSPVKLTITTNELIGETRGMTALFVLSFARKRSTSSRTGPPRSCGRARPETGRSTSSRKLSQDSKTGNGNTWKDQTSASSTSSPNRPQWTQASPRQLPIDTVQTI